MLPGKALKIVIRYSANVYRALHVLLGFPCCGEVGKPCDIYRLQGNPIIIVGFPAICKYYRVYPQHYLMADRLRPFSDFLFYFHVLTKCDLFIDVHQIGNLTSMLPTLGTG